MPRKTLKLGAFEAANRPEINIELGRVQQYRFRFAQAGFACEEDVEAHCSIARYHAPVAMGAGLVAVLSLDDDGLVFEQMAIDHESDFLRQIKECDSRLDNIFQSCGSASGCCGGHIDVVRLRNGPSNAEGRFQGCVTIRQFGSRVD